MHIHNVYFWLKDDQNAESRTEFEEGLSWLTGDPVVVTGYFGKPAHTHRDVVENSYSYGLVLVFEDIAAHDRYQEGSAHLRFLEKNMDKWDKVAVYDIDS
jgi:hypothetical protein